MQRRSKITPAEEAKILKWLERKPHASFVAGKTGRSFSTVWRIADRAGVELTAGREAKGYKRLAPKRVAKVIEARRENPDAPQIEIARAAGVSRSTVWRIEGGSPRRRDVAAAKLG
jgi:DNA-binding XRE family transcriptional regulator